MDRFIIKPAQRFKSQKPQKPQKHIISSLSLLTLSGIRDLSFEQGQQNSQAPEDKKISQAKLPWGSGPPKKPTKVRRSQRAHERKFEYDEKRRRKKLAAALSDVLHVPSSIQFSDGDVHIPVPPYVRFLLKLGPKYTPHMTTHVAFKVFRQRVFGELNDLERVLLWNVYFNIRKDDRPNFFETMPHKGFTALKALLSPIEECGRATFDGTSSIACARDSLICAFSQTKLTELPRRGVGLTKKILRDFTNHYLVVSGDKDASHTIMLVAAYQSEVALHMKSCMPDGIFRYVKLGYNESDFEWWLERARIGWKRYINV